MINPDNYDEAEISARAALAVAPFEELRHLVDPTGATRCMLPWCEGNADTHAGPDPDKWMHATRNDTLIPLNAEGTYPVAAHGAFVLELGKLEYVISADEVVIRDAAHLLATARYLRRVADRLEHMAPVFDMDDPSRTELLAEYDATATDGAPA